MSAIGSEDKKWAVGSVVEGTDYNVAPDLLCVADFPGAPAVYQRRGAFWVIITSGDVVTGLTCRRYVVPPPLPASGAPVGDKKDAGKNRLGLLPPHALWEVGQALTFGAKKYSDDNWRQVPELRKRYTDALFRHVLLWMKGERNDSESGLHHLAHAGACLLFLLEDELLKK